MTMTTPALRAEWTPPDRFPLEMHACDENVYLARALVDQATEAWELPSMRDIGRLILTELVTNAARLYTGSVIHAWIARPHRIGPIVLEVGVWDCDGAHMPHVVPPEEADESGRGLYLVRGMTGGQLGWFPARQGGKVVWARWGLNTDEESHAT